MGSGLCLSAGNKTRGNTTDVRLLCIHCFHCARETKLRQNSNTTCFHELQKLKKNGAVDLVIFIKSRKRLNILSFNQDVFHLQLIISW